MKNTPTIETSTLNEIRQTFQEKGQPQKVVLQQLKSRLQRDFTYDSGMILSSMCTQPHNFATKVFTQNLDKNLGDPTLFPATAEIEKETIQMLGSLISNPNASGNIVTGGTEANILALWAFRNLANKHRREVIVPNSAHFSFDKAADLLNLKLVRVRLNSDYQVDVKAVEKAVSSKTLAIVGVAGTTELGVVDPISELSEIALKHDMCLHVDAAFGGFVLPFLRDLGYAVPSFDFREPGVCSITMDPHKMGLAPIPAGGILFRDAAFLEGIAKKVPYMADVETKQTALVGTRSGASAIAVWSLLKHLGMEGYRKIIGRCMRLTLKFANEIQQIEGISLATQPTMNIVGIKSDRINVQWLMQELRSRGWAISLIQNFIRIVIMPHTRLSYVENLLEDIKHIVKRYDRH